MNTPIFIFEEEKLKQNFQTFHEVCKTYLKNFQICYSIKTNSDKKIINSLAKLNSGFEIASMNELKLVQKQNKFTTFNSPAKTEEEIKLF